MLYFFLVTRCYQHSMGLLRGAGMVVTDTFVRVNAMEYTPVPMLKLNRIVPGIKIQLRDVEVLLLFLSKVILRCVCFREYFIVLDSPFINP